MTAFPASLSPPDTFGKIFRRAALWLLFLAPFFYLTYGYANWLASQRGNVGSIVFYWEYAVPFVAWTILPYWSINLFYGLSLLINTTTGGVDRLAGRYLTAQIIAVACFIAFPLTATFTRPATDGLPGFMFAVLGGFDKPFNQAPSLHIALLVIIWDHIRHRLAGGWNLLWHLWCLLIGASVLTTWQHHFIDIPTGALLGLFALWLFPRESPLPFAGARLARDGKARRLAAGYGLGAALLLAVAAGGAFISPVWLFFLWPALSLAIVAFAYATRSASVFQKSADGHVTLASRLLLLPYRIGARLNAWAWTRRLPRAVMVADGIFLGRYPSAAEAARFVSVIDLAAEFERPSDSPCTWKSFPMLDLLPPHRSDLAIAAEAVEAARLAGPVLVCCALGFQRSAGVVAEWLLRTDRAANFDQARSMIAAAGRPVHLHEPAEP
ncbi:phosphatase PAP2/dual specificity phosphatase family protein [Mesorhizobium sp. LHD-90]|uniref:phosphatase PAP2/dual specificity phosphatase family protein n=1 Tax=Mesorhizobium sp. LHD-90 TaxID=3071414 RepID=UPI0027DFB815|nr:phosphatase PAP2/dual specificity phosphatase family protein [Mesorhizobium sp. LHD-90]MDQ6432784.1 phosphatase PAP2/dual specificity phosphatase family protein [Mesorhizobium sp. LHD-90]